MELVYIITFSPSFLILGYIYFSDRYKEPILLVLSTFLLGHFLCIPAGILNEYFIFSSNTPDKLSFIAGLVEEPLKFSVLYFFIRKRKMFDEPMDAIVYGTLISLGFATLENIEYVFLSNQEIPSIIIAFIRAFTAIPLHACCGIIMGYYFGLYYFRPEKSSLIKSLIVPTGIHCLYNYLTNANTLYFALFLIAVIIFAAKLHRKVKNEQKGKLFEAENRLRN